MHSVALRWMTLGGVGLCFIYYLTVICCARNFFLKRRKSETEYLPPVSVLKPVRGLEEEAYANFASFCLQDYPEYEILFGASDANDAAIPIIQKLIQDFPDRSIRLVLGSKRFGSNDKVSNLCELAREARQEILVVSDSDVRVAPDYLRAVAAPFRDPKVGVVTCMYIGKAKQKLSGELEAVGLSSEFLAGVVVARQLERVKFALGATMATTRQRLAEIGGFEAIADCFSDDFELGKRVASKGYRVELLSYTVELILHSRTPLDFLKHQLRWAVGVRHCRPWGHLGLLFTQGLFWSLAAIATHPSWKRAAAFLGAYLILRMTMAWTVGVWGLKDPLLRKKWWLVPLWDATSFVVWVASFASNRIHWRGAEFYVRKGRLIPIVSR